MTFPRMSQPSIGDPVQKFFNWIRQHPAELRLTMRVTVAGLCGYAVMIYFHLPQGYWTVLTAVLVVQTSVGGSLKFAVDRMIGTIGGALYGAVIASIIPHGDPLTEALALAAGIAPPALLAALNPSFRIAPVTVVIVLFSATTQHINIFTYAIERVLEIGLGSIIGLFVSLLVLPSRAHRLVATESARTLLLFRGLLSTLLRGLTQPDRTMVSARQDRIRAALAKMDVIADEAARERKTYLSGAADPEPLLRVLRRLRHDLVMIGRSTVQPLPETIARRMAPAIEGVATAAENFLQDCSLALSGQVPLPAPDFEKGFDLYISEMTALRQERKFGDLPVDVVGRIFALSFVLEQLRQNFRDLSGRITEFTTPSRQTRV